MRLPEYLLTIELKEASPFGQPQRGSYWRCNVCDSKADRKHELLDILEGCRTCKTMASKITPDNLRKLQAEWEIRKFLEE